MAWLICLIGLPFVSLVWNGLEMWAVQTIWAEWWAAILLGLALCHSTRSAIPNRPLGCWLIWVFGWTLWRWTVALAHNQAPVMTMFAMLHLIAMVAFYQAACSTWTTERVEAILTGLAWSGAVVAVYCLLQLMNLDQFHQSIDQAVKTSSLVGLLGNPTQLGAHLALLIPCWLFQRRRRWMLVAAASVLLIALTHSASAMLSASVAWGWWWMSRRNARALGASLLGLLMVAVWMLRQPHALDDYHRFSTWRLLWEVFRQQGITGLGIGFLREFVMGITDPAHPLFGWHHAHNEFYQIALEQGIIGLGLVGWMIASTLRHAWDLRATPVGACLGAMWLAFLANSCLNFPAHLWVLGSFGLVAYAGITVIDEEGRHGADLSCERLRA